jgi:hypothetical protein
VSHEYAASIVARQWLALTGLAVAVISACATRSTSSPPGGELLDQTAVGRARCQSAREQQLRPFVVEWDATDLAQFEAQASHDLVLVKYEGCALTVLYSCVDGSVPGRYGRYAPPQFTSGAMERIDIRNQDELFAKLPLGVASFGGRVQQGEALHLQYFVTGMATATRDTLARGSIAANPACAEATHFVWQYHVGAFELAGSKGSEALASAGIGDLGGGAKSTREASSLKQAGNLASCSTNQQRDCRAPIRLVLRKLDEVGASAGDPAPAPSAAAPDEPVSPTQLAFELRNSAREKEHLGDGVGCLADLDRAGALDPNEERNNPGWLYLRAYCTMEAGRCDEGKKLYRDFLSATDKERELDEQTIAAHAESAANAKCPSSTGTLQERILRSLRTISVAADRHPPAAALCLDEVHRFDDVFRQIEQGKLTEKLDPAPQALLYSAAVCLAKAKRCDEAHELWFRYYPMNWPNEPRAELMQAAASVFAALPGCRAGDSRAGDKK